MNARELRAKAAELYKKAKELNELSEKEDRAFSPEEQTQFDQFKTDAEALIKRAEVQEAIPEDLLKKAPVQIKTGLGDSEEKAFAHYFRTGDDGGIRSMRSADENGRVEYSLPLPSSFEKRATDEIMNVAADADGKSAVPVGLVNQIAARRGAIDLAPRLGCRRVIGQGTTVNFPYENADPAVFAATSEQVDALSNTFERDRPTLATKAFTLAKKTKKLELTDELLEDEDAALMSFIADHIGRSIGITKNALLLTEVASNGTSLKSFASATAIAAGELEAIAFHDTLSYYLDDAGAINWIMKPSTFGYIKGITGNFRLYDQQQGQGSRGDLFGYSVQYSGSAGAMSASGKSVYFGNWYYVGVREGNSIGFLRDPYTTDGVVLLKYWFRICFGVLIAGAVGYGVQATG